MHTLLYSLHPSLAFSRSGFQPKCCWYDSKRKTSGDSSLHFSLLRSHSGLLKHSVAMAGVPVRPNISILFILNKFLRIRPAASDCLSEQSNLAMMKLFQVPLFKRWLQYPCLKKSLLVDICESSTVDRHLVLLACLLWTRILSQKATGGY